MGGWKLEVAKMAMYMSFPVGLFYYFNQPSFFEEWMMSRRHELFPPEQPGARRAIQKTIVKLDERREQKWKENMKKVDTSS
ncbi:protein PET100 homolog, mitochondrial-like [Lineus longissimus]|uniref:protein PET100 homolog, mitochondrial-like n=1 Tax=Lineus longissimus TaxID=88925 RepID=UPI002B4D9831